jgi:hypothetical protein
MEYQIVTKKAVPGWADRKQRVFSNGDKTASAARQFANQVLGLKRGEYEVTTESTTNSVGLGRSLTKRVR